MESSALFSSDLIHLLGLSVVLAGALIAFALYRRSRPTLDVEQASAASIAYRDAPTVRIIDSQHFDRLRKTVRLARGEQIDVLASHPIVGPRFRLTLKSIEMLDATPAAHLEIVYSGVQVSCGPLAKELMAEGLLNELHLWLHPVLAGVGSGEDLLLHEGLNRVLQFEDAKTLSSGVVILKYRNQPA